MVVCVVSVGPVSGVVIQAVQLREEFLSPSGSLAMRVGSGRPARREEKLLRSLTGLPRLVSQLDPQLYPDEK